MGRRRGGDKPQAVEWWRNDADLLANTRDGSALPVGTLEISRRCAHRRATGMPLARVAGRAAAARARCAGAGQRQRVFPGHAARRSVQPGARRRGHVRAAAPGARRRRAHAGQGAAAVRGGRRARGRPGPVASRRDDGGSHGFAESLPLRAGVLASGDRLVALNRPPGEDLPQTLSTARLNELFAGLDFRVLTDTLEDSRSLTNEVWRTFLLAMAVCLRRRGAPLPAAPARGSRRRATKAGRLPRCPPRASRHETAVPVQPEPRLDAHPGFAGRRAWRSWWYVAVLAWLAWQRSGFRPFHGLAGSPAPAHRRRASP